MPGVNLSISAAATEFGVGRDTMRRVLQEAGIEPSGIGPRGYPTYRLRDVVRALNGRREVEDLNPHLRLALARAIECEDRIRKSRGELVEVADMAREVGRLVMIFVRGLESAPDVVERDCGLTVKQLKCLEEHFDRIRTDLADLIEKDPDDDAS